MITFCHYLNLLKSSRIDGNDNWSCPLMQTSSKSTGNIASALSWAKSVNVTGVLRPPLALPKSTTLASILRSAHADLVKYVQDLT